MPPKKWTYDSCKEVAIKFDTLKEFRCTYPSAYAAAKKNNWISQYNWMAIGKNAGYWDYDKCYAEALKYNTISDFAKGCSSAHFRAKENEWIKDYTWFVDGKIQSAKKRTIWDYEACYKLALKCRKKSELKEKNNRAYNVARKNGWFKDYTWFLSDDVIRHQKRPSRVKWTFETCRQEAIKYKTRGEFSKGSPSAYTISNRNNWIEEFDWLDRIGNIYNNMIDNVYAYFFYDFHAVYVGRTINPADRHLNHTTNDKSSVYKFSILHGISMPRMTILEDKLTIIQGLKKEDYYRKKFESDGWKVLNIAKTGKKSGSLGGLGSGKWTYRTCYNEAKKYKTLKEFRKKSPSAYNVSCKNNWQNDYVWLTTVLHKGGYWNYERCYQEARKYETRKQFQVGNASAYDKALKEKWINDYEWFAPSASAPKWDYDSCFIEAKKYTKLADFIKNCGRTYKVAKDNDWIKDYIWLKKKDISKKVVLQYSLQGKFIARYNGVREATRINGFSSNSGISMCCNGKLNYAYGFIWRYENDE